MRNTDAYKKYLPDWGPYSKKYMGVSRACDDGPIPGSRFDMVVFPTLANSGVPVPNVTVPSAYHPWQASPDLHYYSYRYDLEWKDRCYAEVSFSQKTKDQVIIRTEFVNNTDEMQYGCLNYFSAIEYPYPYEYQLLLPRKHEIWDALEYEHYNYARPRPWDALNPDGMKKGEFYDSHFIGHHGLGDRVNKEAVFEIKHWDYRAFGTDEGDRVQYRRVIEEDYEVSEFFIRGLVKEELGRATYVLCITQEESGQTVYLQTVVFDSTGSVLVGGADRIPAYDSEGCGAVRASKDKNAASEEAACARKRAASTGSPRLYHLTVGKIPKGTYVISFVSVGHAGMELDCFAILEHKEMNAVHIVKHDYEIHPGIEVQKSNVVYQYEDCGLKICFASLAEDVRYREIESGVLEDAWISRLSNWDETFDDVLEPFGNAFSRKHSASGYYHNCLVPSISIEPRGRHIEYAVVGEREKIGTKEECEQIFEECRAIAFSADMKCDGNIYQLCTRILGATELTNIVYPIRLDGCFVKHHTPGKRWDSLYTWDSGMIGLGIFDMEPGVAEYILDLYLAEPCHKDYAFVHHGTPIPTHIYLYQEMLNHSEQKSHLLSYYERAKRYYDFLAGNCNGSVTGRLKSGLLTTFDYFFNCSGMDDLPPQMYVKEQGAAGTVAPVIPTCQVMRTAKILYMVALYLGYDEDAAQFERDIERCLVALQQTWDEESGYFGYLVHDEEGNPKNILCTENGENLNKTMEGIYPLIAGACTKEQEAKILSHIRNPRELFSSVGISSVDQSAGYFKKNGYWNGNVWFPHQWFLWKTLLDMGEGALAYEIAHNALEIWRQEVERSYYTYEQINIETGRGGWFHHFSGLSSVISVWASAYYRPGRVNTGFELWIDEINFKEKNTQCLIKFHKYNRRRSILLVSMAEWEDGYEVRVADNARRGISVLERTSGTLEINLEEEMDKGTIYITGRCR